MTNQEIWNRACERVGKFRAGACGGDNDVCEPNFVCSYHRDATRHTYPRIGDPDSMAIMLKRAVEDPLAWLQIWTLFSQKVPFAIAVARAVSP